MNRHDFAINKNHINKFKKKKKKQEWQPTVHLQAVQWAFIV